MKAFFDALLDLFFPRRCPFCRCILKDYEKAHCKACSEKLPWARGSAQRQVMRHIELCVSPLFYEENVRSALLRFKFHGLRVYAASFARIMADALRQQEISFDLITWVPVSAKRLKQRGYDQAQLLAEELSELTLCPCRRILLKTNDNPAQSSLKSPEQRRKNVAGVYRLCDPESVKGCRILLVDDIVTTGATINECARMLRSAGAEGVFGVTLARSRHS